MPACSAPGTRSMAVRVTAVNTFSGFGCRTSSRPRSSYICAISEGLRSLVTSRDPARHLGQGIGLTLHVETKCLGIDVASAGWTCCHSTCRLLPWLSIRDDGCRWPGSRVGLVHRSERSGWRRRRSLNSERSGGKVGSLPCDGPRPRPSRPRVEGVPEFATCAHRRECPVTHDDPHDHRLILAGVAERA